MSPKYIFWFVIIILSFFSSTFAYKELIIQNIDKKAVRVIKVVLDWQHFVVSSVAWDGGATLEELTKKVWWDSSVNGTFFCPDDYSSCGGVTHTNSERIYLGDWVNWSRYRPDTSIRMMFGFDRNWVPAFVQNNMWNIHDMWLWIKPDQKKLESLLFGIGWFPAFLLEGEDVVKWYNVYLDTKMRTAWNKTFICSTEDWSTIYMGVVWWITIPQMPAFLKKNFACRNSLNLDAGESIWMIYSWFVLDKWRRTRVMDAFVVLTREQYVRFTGITPPTKTPYDAGEQYELTEKDQQKVKNIYNALQPFIIKNGSKQKRSLISILRSAVTSTKIISDPQKLSIIKDLLRRFFVVWEL